MWSQLHVSQDVVEGPPYLLWLTTLCESLIIWYIGLGIDIYRFWPDYALGKICISFKCLFIFVQMLGLILFICDRLVNLPLNFVLVSHFTIHLNQVLQVLGHGIPLVDPVGERFLLKLDLHSWFLALRWFNVVVYFGPLAYLPL